MPVFGNRSWFAAAVFLISVVFAVNVSIILRAWQPPVVNDLPHSYVEFDFPSSLLPLDQHPYNARLTVEDTVHYQINSTIEWQSLFPLGGGFVHLGPKFRQFGVSGFHQLHCLDKMRRAIIKMPPTPWDRWHAQHCLNYVRQMVLCAANTRIEPVKRSPNGPKVDGLGLTHTCRDWSMLREKMDENFHRWADTLEEDS